MPPLRISAAVDGRAVVFVLVRQVAPTEVALDAAPVLVEPNVLAHAPVQAEIGIGVLRRFVEPDEEIIVRADPLIALHRAAEPDRLDPDAAEILEDRPGTGDVGQGWGAHDAARHHKARMRPLPSEE